MQKIDDSFDGTFTDNIKSNAYKSQFTNKKHKIVINVSGIAFSLSFQKHNMPLLNMLPKRINGILSLIQYPV